MVELSSGEYKTSASPVNVEQLMNQLVLSTGHDKFTIDIDSELYMRNTTISFDEKMASIILQNTLTNAVAHGGGRNIEFAASFRNKGARWTSIKPLFLLCLSLALITLLFHD